MASVQGRIVRKAETLEKQGKWRVSATVSSGRDMDSDTSVIGGGNVGGPCSSHFVLKGYR